MSDKSSENSAGGTSFAALFEAEDKGNKAKKLRTPGLGERVRAEVVKIGKDDVFVEIVGAPGAKRLQAYLSHEDVRGADGAVALVIGDSVEAVVVDNKGGELRLGRTMGTPKGAEELERAAAARVAVEGKVTGVNKGGLDVEVGGIRAFCPISQADRTFVADPQSLVGRSLQFLVTEVKEGGRRVVVSRRALLEQESRAQADEVRAKLVVGAVLRGTVSAVREFGAFVDLGGVEGLLPNAEISHDRGQRATGTLSPGDSVEVQVREIKEGVVDKRGRPTTKITLSLKALSADPWDAAESVAPVGRVLRGTVARVVDFGAFVRIASGIEGLLHASELGGNVADASTVLSAGQSVDVVVRALDKAARKCSLTLAPEGLSVGAEVRGPSLSIGAIVNGTVERVEPFGVFMQIDGTRGREGRGLIPNVELGTPRGADTRKLFPVGHKLQAKVLETGDGKLRLSLRAVKDDEERADFDGYRAREVDGKKLGTFADLLRKR
jgi:small subunit ribosomal protein S1